MNKNELAELHGVSSTVYSLILKETHEIEQMCRKSMPFELYGQPWTAKQDSMHVEFFETWVERILSKCSNVESFEQMNELFPFYYPCNGSSEAIRDVISAIPKDECIICFEGEYEGYKALAGAYQVDCFEIEREHDLKELHDAFYLMNREFKAIHFFISQPSSIDGNVWLKFDEFMKSIQSLNVFDFNIKVHLDLCYVGSTSNSLDINITNYDCIENIFFSLSKVYGVYFHRIGGVFCRNERKGLWGNKWFKNLFSLYFGTELMKQLGHDNMAKYKEFQIEAISKMNCESPLFPGNVFVPSDVVILSYIKNVKIKQLLKPHEKMMMRGTNTARLCLTPGLSSVISIPEHALSTDPFSLRKS